MSEARVLPFRRRPPGKESFAALDHLPQLIEWQRRLIGVRHGPQAFTLGHGYFVQMFDRLRKGDGPFLHDHMAAHALGVSPCVYRRRRAQFPEWFAHIDEQISRSFGRLSGEKPTEKVITFRRTSSTKSKPAVAQIVRTSIEEQVLQPVPSIEGESPVVALAAKGRASPLAIAEKEAPAAPAETPIPPDWRPDDPAIGPDGDRDTNALWIKARAEALRTRLLSPNWPSWWQCQKRLAVG